MALDKITTGIIADDAVTAAKIVSGAVVADIANDSIDSQHYVAGSIDNEHLADNAVGTDELADNAVTLAKMAGGTDGNLITYDTSGNPAYVATGTSGHVLTSAGADAVPTFQAAAGGGGSNVPAFMYQIDGNQTGIAYATDTKILFDEEIWDTNSDFASYKFTPTVAGYYHIGLNVYHSDTPDGDYVTAAIYKNGSKVTLNRAHASHTQEITCCTSAIVQMNGSSDYIEGYGAHSNSSAQSFIGDRTYATTYIYGFLIIE